MALAFTRSTRCLRSSLPGLDPVVQPAWFLVVHLDLGVRNRTYQSARDHQAARHSAPRSASQSQGCRQGPCLDEGRPLCSGPPWYLSKYLSNKVSELISGDGPYNSGPSQRLQPADRAARIAPSACSSAIGTGPPVRPGRNH